MNPLLVLTRVATVAWISLLPALAHARPAQRTALPRRIQRCALDEGRERRLRMLAARHTCGRLMAAERTPAGRLGGNFA